MPFATFFEDLVMYVRPSRLIALFAVISAAISGRTPVVGAVADPNASFYDLKTSTLDGKPADLGQYRGKVALVVNVASKCGYTPQYAGLEKLHRELGPKGVAVLGFPSNDFGGQEPGTPAEIQEFCRLKYDVTFPLFEKVVTKAGPDQSPVYTFLGTSGSLPGWNFGKYVIGRDGKVVGFFPSKVTPESPELRAAIDKALAAS
jgi:glutathione peroxidase